MSSQENEYDVPTTCAVIEAHLESVKSGHYLGTWAIDILNSYSENFLIHSLMIKDLFKNFNEQVYSTFIFSNPVNFYYYEPYSGQRIDMISNFLILNGVEKIDIIPYASTSCYCSIHLIVTDDNFKTYTIYLNRVFITPRKDVMSLISEKIREEVKWRGPAKLTFRRAKRKNSQKKALQNNIS